MDVNDFKKMIQQFEESEPVWDNDDLDAFMKYHSKIEDVMIVMPKKLFDGDSIKTKYGRLKVVVNPYLPPNQILLTAINEELMKPPLWR